jgi:hypothetical protein
MARFEDPPALDEDLSEMGPKFCLSCHRLDAQRKVRGEKDDVTEEFVDDVYNNDDGY